MIQYGCTLSFSDAESSKDPIEDIIRHHGTDNLTQLVDGRFQVDNDQLVPGSAQETLRGPSER